MAKTPTWQRAEGKNPEGGLNEKGRASLRAAGHDIKRPQPEGGARKDSFCARMKGMKAKLTSSETANDPDSRINKSLRKWKCADGGAVDPYKAVQSAANTDNKAPYGFVDMGDKIIIGSPHGDQIPLSDELKSRIQDVASKSGAWYEGTGGDIEQNKKLIPSYKGSWDDQVSRNVEGYPSEYLSPMFSNIEVNKPQEIYVDPKRSIFESILANQDRAKYFKDRRFDDSALRDFLSQGSEGDTDFVKMSQLPATKENLRKFFSTGERLMWPENWQEYPHKLGKLAKRFEESRNRYLLNAPPGVYVTGAGHIPELRGINKDLKVIGGERASEADGGAVDSVPLPPERPTELAAQDAANAFPAMWKNVDPVVKITPGRQGGYSEAYGPDEPGDPSNPSSWRPAEFPYGRTGIEVYKPETKGVDLGLELLHTDPRAIATRNALLPTISPEQKHVLSRGWEDYDESIRQKLSEQKAVQNVVDAMERSYIANKTGLPHHQGPQSAIDALRLGEDQRRLLDKLYGYTQTGEYSEGGTVDPYDAVQHAAKGGPIWDKPRPKKLGKPEPLSSKEKASAKAAAKAAGRPYPNLIDNMRAAKAEGGPADDRAHEFVQEQLRSGEPQVSQYNPEAGMETAKEAGRMLAGMTTPGAIADAAGYLGGPSALQNAREGNYGTAALQLAGAVPGVGPFAKAARIAEEARGAEDVYRAVQQAAQAPIKAYHYSPHAFERFETGHAGTGASGTSFGHGLYFGSKEDDARMWQQRINQERGLPKESGHMYEAELALDPSKMIDYNKFLHEQPEFVRDALINKLGYEPKMFEAPAEGSFGGGKPRGDMAVPQSEGAMKAWRDAGIHGVQYYDPSNSYRGYVAFSGEPVSILRRYANGGQIEGDVQFADDDPYAKVQEAAKLPMMAQNDFAMRMPQPEVRYDTGPQPGEATLKGYDPTIKERIYQGIAGTEERPSPERAQFARGMSQMAEFAPVLGNVMAGQEAQRRGDTKGMLMAALPVPGMATEARMAEAAISPAEQAAREAYQRVLNAQGMYSHAAEAAYNLPQAKGSYEQMMAMLKSAGVKPEEMRWSGVEQFAGQPVTREQLASHFEQNIPKIEESIYTAEDPRSAMYRYGSGTRIAIPGGENYREVLLGLDTPRVWQNGSPVTAEDLATPMGRESVERSAAFVNTPYQSSHWDQPNVLGHLRMSDRTGPEGEKILHLEELQSDWGQKGREKGFRNEENLKLKNDISDQIHEMKRNLLSKSNQLTDDWANKRISVEEMNAANQALYADYNPKIKALQEKYDSIPRSGDLPSAPYVEKTQNWVDLGLKRALKEAAEGGYSKMVWTPGEEQAARYDLSKHIDELRWHNGNLIAYDKNGDRVIEKSGMSASELSDAVGKDVADKLLAQEAGSDGWRSLEGQDLKVGGEGMKGFYDKIVPTRLKELLKKIDPQAKIELGGHEIGSGRYQVVAPNGKVIADYPQIQSANAIAKNIPGSKVIQEPGVKTHSVEITPKLREAILKGLPAYAHGGEVVNNDDPYDNIRLKAKNFPRARRASH